MRSKDFRLSFRSAALAAALVAAPGCLLRPAVRPIPAPVVSAGRVTLPPIAPGLAPMVLDGAWTTTADGRTCVDGGTVQLLTAAGGIPLQDAHLCVTASPLSIDGEATVGFPAIGFLAQAGVHAETGHARVHLAVGRQIGHLDLGGGHVMRAAADHYYLFLDVASGLDVKIGQASLSGPGGSETIVVDAQEPMIYVAGQLRGPGVSIDGAFGFSPAGRLSLKQAAALRGPGGQAVPAVTGQVLVSGSMPLEGLPITVSGDLLIDIDSNRDGRTFFDGDLQDLRVLVNGAVSLGYDKKGFGMSLKVGQGSLVFDARAGLVAVAGDAGGVFDGTPLAALSPARAHLDGYFHGPADFALHVASEASILGQRTNHVVFALDPSGVHLQTTLTLPFGMGGVAVAGDVLASGQFALRGTANLTIAGLRMAAAKVAFSPAGVAIDGRVAFLGTWFAVHGGVARGHVSLGGAVSLNLVVFRGDVALRLNDARISALVRGQACVANACMPLAGMEIDRRGRVCPIFPVIGKQCIKIL